MNESLETVSTSIEIISGGVGEIRSVLAQRWTPKLLPVEFLNRRH